MLVEETWNGVLDLLFLGKSKKIKILRYRNFLPTQLCWAATTNPGQLECSSYFLLDHNDKTGIYRLVSGSFDVSLRRKPDFPMAPPPRVK